ncbi:MAG: hypothetical protein ACLUCE_07605 [Streptococcus sp.]|uniref:hypothetical protein n=1 Tax=Streptococcus sp. TaxID=1306 RepID=UPI0039962EB4
MTRVTHIIPLKIKINGSISVQDSKALKGEQVINGVTVFFDKDGVQAKGIFADDGFYYDKDSGARVNLGNNQFVQVNGNWYYLNNEGKIVKGEQVINGNNFYFDKDGKQVKGNFAENGAYYDENSVNEYRL